MKRKRKKRIDKSKKSDIDSKWNDPQLQQWWNRVKNTPAPRLSPSMPVLAKVGKDRYIFVEDI